VSWIGIDLDGCLAHSDGQWNDGKIGPPISRTVARVKRFLDAGCEVRIFTARVAYGGGHSPVSDRTAGPAFAEEQRALIEAWCLEHLGVVLPVTAEKDHLCVELHDDCAVQIVRNTGQRVDGNP
jgi:hypothetical protein